MKTPKKPNIRRIDNVTTSALRYLLTVELSARGWPEWKIAGFVHACEVFGALRQTAPAWLRAHAAHVIACGQGLDENTVSRTDAAVREILRSLPKPSPAMGEGESVEE